MPSPSIRAFIPYLSISGAGQAISFYSRVFGVEPHVLLKMPDGRVMHCEFRIGDSRFFLSEELPEHGGTPSPKRLGATSVSIHVYVEDCDALFADMIDHGSTELMAPTDMFFGERFARVRDPFGHEWGLAAQVRHMTPEELAAAAERLFAKDSE